MQAAILERVCIMNYTDLKKLFNKNSGILKASDLINFGFTRYEIHKLHNQNKIERVKNGYYKLENDNQSDAGMISILYPAGILCMNTALFYYEYSDRTPLSWHIAVNKDISKSKFKLNYPKIKPYYLEPNILNIGITTMLIGGYNLKIYDKERVICDCFKYKNKMDSETFNKAINAYVNDDKKNIANLIDYAKKLRVYRKMSGIMEVLLNA